MKMNLTDKDLNAIKNIVAHENTRLEARLDGRIDGKLYTMEQRLIKRIDDLDYSLTTYIDGKISAIRKEIRSIKKGAQRV